MKLTVCTGWNPDGWNEYGRRFYESFDRYWHPSVDLVIYGEEPRDLHSRCGRRIQFRQLLDIPGMREFFRQFGHIAKYCGREPQSWWKQRQRDSGYNFRFDGVKFSRQGFIPLNAAQHLDLSKDPQYLAWLDGDVVTHSPVPLEGFLSLLPPSHEVAYLGRGAKHSEIGFQLYRIGADSFAMDMLEDFSAMYSSGAVFDLKEWHSAYVWDHCRRESLVKAYDLTPGGTGHVWHQSPLRAWTDHLKGDRKKHDRSPEARR